MSHHITASCETMFTCSFDIAHPQLSIRSPPSLSASVSLHSLPAFAEPTCRTPRSACCSVRGLSCVQRKYSSTSRQDCDVGRRRKKPRSAPDCPRRAQAAEEEEEGRTCTCRRGARRHSYCSWRCAHSRCCSDCGAASPLFCPIHQSSAGL